MCVAMPYSVTILHAHATSDMSADDNSISQIYDAAGT